MALHFFVYGTHPWSYLLQILILILILILHSFSIAYSESIIIYNEPALTSGERDTRPLVRKIIPKTVAHVTKKELLHNYIHDRHLLELFLLRDAGISHQS